MFFFSLNCLQFVFEIRQAIADFSLFHFKAEKFWNVGDCLKEA
jgi:hypothetical protein